MLRTRIRTFIDYNPNSEFWGHALHGQPDVEVIISDHRHNPYLSAAEHAKIEVLKGKDLELWRVYARGLTGRIEGLVLTKWSVCEEIPADAKHRPRHGLCFYQ
jgi:phage terminase large subunit